MVRLSFYTRHPRFRTRVAVYLEICTSLTLMHANKCRCGSKRLRMERTSFTRITCLSCQNKTEAFYNLDAQYLRGKQWRDELKDRMMKTVEAWNRGEYMDWRDEYEYVCAKEPLSLKIPTPKLKSDKYYRKLLEKEYASHYYVDQAFNESRYADLYMFSAYTPTGIQILDRWYGEAIREMGYDDARFNYTPKELRKMILKNPHLHELIKWNLISNLNSRTVKKFIS